jgi:hypothetical protein
MKSDFGLKGWNIIQEHASLAFRVEDLKTLKIEAACSSETLVSTYKTLWCYSPEEHI